MTDQQIEAMLDEFPPVRDERKREEVRRLVRDTRAQRVRRLAEHLLVARGMDPRAAWDVAEAFEREAERRAER